MNDDELQALWQDDGESPPKVDLDDVRRKHQRFERIIGRRNALELFAAGLVTASFGGAALAGEDGWAVTGNALVAAGAGVVALVIATRGASPEAEPGHQTADFVEAYRRSLRYQARLLSAVPWWYIGPLVPGTVVRAIGRWPGPGEDPLPTMGYLAIVVVVFAGVGWLNLRAARELRRRAEALPSWG